MKPKLLLFLLLGLLAAGAGVWYFAGLSAPREEHPPVFPRGTVTLERADGYVEILDVEIAKTPEQYEYGLMFRRSLPPDTGMLFLFEPPMQTSFWMKNTFIPLDMLFARQDGVIVKIAAHTVPQTLTSIRPGEPAAYVLEIGGGEAGRLGVRVGDRLHYKGIGD